MIRLDDVRGRALLDLCRAHGARAFVSGVCMEPAMSPGDAFSVRPTRFFWPGDLCAFVGVDGLPRVHRTLGYTFGRGGVRLVTKGDRNGVADPPTPLSKVIGRVGGASPRERTKAALRWTRWTVGALIRGRS